MWNCTKIKGRLFLFNSVCQQEANQNAPRFKGSVNLSNIHFASKMLDTVKIILSGGRERRNVISQKHSGNTAGNLKERAKINASDGRKKKWLVCV